MAQPRWSTAIKYNKFEGIAFVTQAQQSEYGLAPVSLLPEYLAGQPMNVIRHGIVWVYTEQAVTPVDIPFLRHTVDETKLCCPEIFAKTRTLTKR